MFISLHADAGSTKTDWLLIVDNKSTFFHTQGINPMSQNLDDIKNIIQTELIKTQIAPSFPQISHIDGIEFYGAGCISNVCKNIADIIKQSFSAEGISINNVEVGSDIIGAARAVCGDKAGIACILGTGSNSCLFNGHRIIGNTPPLGYILGDEGSGSAIGKRLINALYKNRLSTSLLRLFEQETHLNRDTIIWQVYHQPLAGRFLASLSMFVASHINEYDELRDIIHTEFDIFIERNINPYNRHDLAVGAVGGVAWQYRNILSAALQERGYTVGKIMKTPLQRT